MKKMKKRFIILCVVWMYIFFFYSSTDEWQNKMKNKQKPKSKKQVSIYVKKSITSDVKHSRGYYESHWSCSLCRKYSLPNISTKCILLRTSFTAHTFSLYVWRCSYKNISPCVVRFTLPAVHTAISRFSWEYILWLRYHHLSIFHIHQTIFQCINDSFVYLNKNYVCKPL